MKKLLLLGIILSGLSSVAQFVATNGPIGGGIVNDVAAWGSTAYATINNYPWHTSQGNDWKVIDMDVNLGNIGPRGFAELDGKLYMGALDGARAYRSTDNGASWQPFNGNMPNAWGNPSFVPIEMLRSGDRVFFAGTNFGVAYVTVLF